MKITVVTSTDATFHLDVSDDLELENFKAFCEVESGVPAADVVLVHNGQRLSGDHKTLKDHGLIDGDLVMLQTKQQRSQHHSHHSSKSARATTAVPQFDFSGIQVPGSTARPTTVPNHRSTRQDEDDPAYIRDQLLQSPEQIALLKQNNPPLAEALLSGNFERFSKIIRDMQQHHREKELQRIRLLTSDSMDIEAQKLIEAEIRQKQVDANMEAAMEFSPESFGTVCMLYINLKVNGVPVKAFIDSGAQTTIMSTDCAERCKIMRLVDHRFSGIAKGVGTQRIIGRIHMVQVQIGSDFFVSSFSILEDQKMDMLLGLDMLKRHQCVIDLQNNVLKIGTTGTETPFLPESELPESARLSHNEEDENNMGEDAGLARAIEESTKDHQRKSHHSQQGGTGGAGAGPSSQPPHSASTTTGANSFSEETIREIVSMGFPREKVIIELSQNNGDKMQTIAALIAKSLKF